MINKRKKGGLSTIVATLIIILLVLIAVGILWVVVRNVIKGGSEEISLGKLTVSLKIEKAQILNEENLSVTIKRESGKGEISGLLFVIEDEGNSETITENISLSELEIRTFILTLENINTENIKTIKVVPFFKLESGKQVIGDVKDEYIISTSSEEGGEAPYVPPTWQTGMVSWWKLDGNAIDSVGTNNGMVSGATIENSGCVSGECYSFDGINDYIQVAYASDLNPGSNLTMAAWIYWEGTSGDQNIITKENSYEFRVNSGGVNYATNPWTWRGGSSALINPNTWAHVVITHEGNGQQGIYINGTNKYSATSGGNIVSNTNPLTIGRRLAGTSFFNGKVDEVMIWNRVLNSTEIQQVYGYSG